MSDACKAEREAAYASGLAVRADQYRALKIWSEGRGKEARERERALARTVKELKRLLARERAAVQARDKVIGELTTQVAELYRDLQEQLDWPNN